MSQQDEFVFGPYWNGETDRFADPLRVDRDLRAKSQGQIWAWLRDLRAVPPVDQEGDPLEILAANQANRMMIADKARRAAECLIPLLREVFRMVPYDEIVNKGATESDCHRVLTAWFAFVAGEKKNPAPSAPAPTSTPDTPTGQ